MFHCQHLFSDISCVVAFPFMFWSLQLYCSFWVCVAEFAFMLWLLPVSYAVNKLVFFQNMQSIVDMHFVEHVSATICPSGQMRSQKNNQVFVPAYPSHLSAQSRPWRWTRIHWCSTSCLPPSTICCPAGGITPHDLSMRCFWEFEFTRNHSYLEAWEQGLHFK